MRQRLNMTARMHALGEMMTASGLTIVEVSAADVPLLNPAMSNFLEYGFQDSFNRFASAAGGDFPVSSVADVIADNSEDMTNRAPYGRGLLEGSVNTEITAEAYAAMGAQARTDRAAALQTVLAGADARLIDETMISYPVAGFPSITLPLGYQESGQPVGIRLTGDYLSEPQLIAVAYANEQLLQARRALDLDAVLESFGRLDVAEAMVE